MPESTTIYRGLTASVTFASYLEDDEGVQYDDDLTGHTFEAHVRNPHGAALVADLSIYFTLAAPNQVQFTMDPVDTQALSPGTFSWDVVAVSPGGERSFLVPTEPFVVTTPKTHYTP